MNSESRETISIGIFKKDKYVKKIKLKPNKTTVHGNEI